MHARISALLASHSTLGLPSSTRSIRTGSLRCRRALDVSSNSRARGDSLALLMPRLVITRSLQTPAANSNSNSIQRSAGTTTTKGLHSSAQKSQSTTAMDFAHPYPSVLSRSNNTVARPSNQALKTLFVASAIPMVGFGMMDNLVMIQAGQYIDSTLGVSLGLATMTAAAAGQVVSDVSGVVFGGALERVLHKARFIENPPLTTAQRQLAISRNVSMFGAVVGVVIGCALGATSLLFVDLTVRERIQHAIMLREVVNDMITAAAANGSQRLAVSTCTIYVEHAHDFDMQPNKSTNEADSQQQQQRTEIKALHKAASRTLQQCATERRVLNSNNGLTLYIPVVKNDKLVAVLEMNHDEKEGSFSLADQQTAQVMAEHIAIFMTRLAE